MRHSPVVSVHSPGIFGLDVYVVLKRAGDRVSKRKRARGRVGKHHKVTKDESMEWFKKKFNGILM